MSDKPEDTEETNVVSLSDRKKQTTLEPTQEDIAKIVAEDLETAARVIRDYIDGEDAFTCGLTGEQVDFLPTGYSIHFFDEESQYMTMEFRITDIERKMIINKVLEFIGEDYDLELEYSEDE